MRGGGISDDRQCVQIARIGTLAHFHTASNIAYSVVAIAPAPGDLSTSRLWMFTLLTLVSAVVVWVVAPPRTECCSPVVA